VTSLSGRAPIWEWAKYYAKRATQLARNGGLADAVARRWARNLDAQYEHREYSATLPEGLGARSITLRLTVPPLPPHRLFAFTDHAVDAEHGMTDTILAVTTGGFAISRDLGRTWQFVRVRRFAWHHFIQMRDIGNGEYLAQATAPGNEESKTAPVDLLVLNERGDVLAHHPGIGHRWHSCRAVDRAGDTLMYAEYPSNIAEQGKRPASCRVMRSRDRGRSWHTVFEQGGEQIRHFHFLQARPGHADEWWLTSGDGVQESRIWRATDDGDSWHDLTVGFRRMFTIGGIKFSRKIFRLTDLAFDGDDVIWATDDRLALAQHEGACVFRSPAGPSLTPELLGIGRWHFRSMVDIGEFWLLLSQRSNQPNPALEDRMPGVYLLPKVAHRGPASLVHLFNLDSYPSQSKAGFTFSKASRAAKDGVFFSFRSSEDVFPAGHKILKWTVQLD
jgi:hypothetical protein